MKYTTYKIAMGILIMSTFGLVTLMATATFEDNPVSYPNSPFPLEKQVYAHGETLTFPITRCSTRSVNLTSSQAFVRLNEDINSTTSTRYNIVSLSAQVQEGCVELVSSPKVIPEYLPEGTYVIELSLAIKGRVKDFVTVLTTIPFRVVSTSTAELLQ